LLKEYYLGLIQQGDAPCEIWCKVKLAKTGSNGDVVKMIQHLLSHGGYNNKYLGGGMKGGCGKEWQKCDGKYRKHTKDAVLEFQRKYSGLKDDGIVGYDTLSKMCEALKVANSADNSKQILCKQQCKCDDIGQRPPRLDNEDPIVPPGVGEYVPTGKDCATIVACIRQMGSSEGHGDKWYKFIKCLGKFKDKIFPPKQKDKPFEDPLGECNPKHCLSGKPKTSTKYSYTSVISYYYDPITGKCKSFPVGAAPFHNLKQCEKCCKGKGQFSRKPSGWPGGKIPGTGFPYGEPKW